MFKFSDLKIGWKLLVAFSGILGVFVAGFFFVFVSLRIINAATGDIYNEGLVGVENLIEADRDAYQSNIAIAQSFRYIESGDLKPVEKYISDVDQNLAQVLERFTVFENVFKGMGREEPARVRFLPREL